MATFIAALPPTVRLVIGSRVAPAFPVGRLRVQGRLLELQQADLNFTLEETREALAVLGVELDSPELKELDLLVEGWPAGVHLAGLALRSASDRHQLLRSLAETDHNVVDFLTSEVIELQPPEVQRFVTETAELEVFDAALCDAVLGRDDSAAMLEQVRDRNLFLLRVDAADRLHRYHHLFSAFLRARLRARTPRRPVELHRAAAEAFVARDDLMSAVRHYVAADELAAAGRLLRKSVLSHLSIADQAVATNAARTCLARIDESALEQAAAHVLDCTAALSLAGATAEVEPWLRRLAAFEPRLDERVRCQLHTVWAQHLLQLGDPMAALEHGDTARALATAAPDAGYAPTLLAVLSARLHLLRDGFDEARAALAAVGTEASPLPPRPRVHVLGARALVELYAGELLEADRLAAEALTGADALGLDPTDDGRAYAELARAALGTERDELDKAEAGFERTMRIVEGGRRPALEVETRLHMARLAAMRGDEPVALDHLAQARLLQPDAAPFVHGRIDRLHVRVCLDLGDRAGAEAVLARLPGSGRGTLLRARAHLAAGRHADAWEILERVRASLTGRRFHVEHGVLRVLALAAMRSDEAPDALREVLELAQPVGFVRTIVGEGPVMWSLLEALPTQGQLTSYVARLLDVAHRVIPAPAAALQIELPEPLTERELTVLRYLASRLDTSGIAEAMYLSANTVRSHVKAIYRKLGVSSRADAVACGRRLGAFAGPQRSLG